MSASDTPGILGVPARQLFWSVVPAADARRLGDAVRFRCEPDLPLALDRLHVVTHLCPSGLMILVAIPPEALRTLLLAALHQRRVVPDSLPPFVVEAGATEADRLALDLLVGPFEPVEAVRRRRLARITSAALLVVALAAVLVGTERRVAHGWRAIAAEHTAVDAQIAAVVPAVAGESLRADLRLVQRLRQAEEQVAAFGRRPGAMHVVDACLRRLPADSTWRISEISSDVNGLRMQGRIAAIAEAQRLQRTLAQLDISGVVLNVDQPQLSPDGTGADLTMRWTWAVR